MYYKTTNGEQEYYLGTVQGYIKKIDWLSGGNNAIIAMDWQSPVGVHAYIYKANLLKKELEIEIPTTSDYSNVEYLGVTPDESNIMFVSYLNKIHLDRRIKLWNILTDNVVSTPIFNPLSFKWITQNEFISVGYQDPELFPLVSVLIFNVDNSETVYLANAKFNIDTFIINSQLSLYTS